MPCMLHLLLSVQLIVVLSKVSPCLVLFNDLLSHVRDLCCAQLGGCAVLSQGVVLCSVRGLCCA